MILYSTGCPRCKILKDRLDREGVEYEVCEDIETMQNLGIQSVPVLSAGGKLYTFAEALARMSEIKRVKE